MKNYNESLFKVSYLFFFVPYYFILGFLIDKYQILAFSPGFLLFVLLACFSIITFSFMLLDFTRLINGIRGDGERLINLQQLASVPATFLMTKNKFIFFYPLSHGISLIFNNIFFVLCFCRCYVSYCMLFLCCRHFFLCNFFPYLNFIFLLLFQAVFFVSVFVLNCNSLLILECINLFTVIEPIKNGKGRGTIKQENRMEIFILVMLFHYSMIFFFLIYFGSLVLSSFLFWFSFSNLKKTVFLVVCFTEWKFSFVIFLLINIFISIFKNCFFHCLRIFFRFLFFILCFFVLFLNFYFCMYNSYLIWLLIK